MSNCRIKLFPRFTVSVPTIDSNMTNDQQILDSLKDPSTRELAFRHLISKYKERLYWHIRKMVLNHDDADDILQNTFIKIWNGLDSFRGESGLFTWLYRIATNESITFLNLRKRRMMTSLTDENEYLIENLESDTYFDGDEWQMILQKAIATLPDKQRLVFNMKYFDEIKYEDMSVILGTSVGALKASYHHAVKKVEEYVKNHETRIEP
ncbi:MAG TPA: RNA polymerase sigma factor [Prolixibacteraceae bacterium]|nr:RNA polymerase sigma factor [Prolixibacteraceae bacterium]